MPESDDASRTYRWTRIGLWLSVLAGKERQRSGNGCWYFANCNFSTSGVESLADDFDVRKGPVSSRVALLLRSAEGKPYFASISSITRHLVPRYGGVEMGRGEGGGGGEERARVRTQRLALATSPLCRRVFAVRCKADAAVTAAYGVRCRGLRACGAGSFRGPLRGPKDFFSQFPGRWSLRVARDNPKSYHLWRWWGFWRQGGKLPGNWTSFEAGSYPGVG